MDQDQQELDELLAVLTEWKLPHLFDNLRAQRFNVEGLLAIEKEDLSAITEYKGEQTLLWRNINKARAQPETGNLPPIPPTVPELGFELGSNPDINAAGPSTSSSSQPLSSSGPGTKRKSSERVAESAVKKKITTLDSARYAEQLDLLNLLKSSRKGQHILKAYESKRSTEERAFLEEKQRNDMVDIIVTNIRDSMESFQHKYFSTIADKIKEIFEFEDTKTYYIAPHSAGNITAAPKGKLPIKLRNKPAQEGARSKSKAGSDNVEESVTSTLQIIAAKPLTTEIEGAAAWLKVSQKPWIEVLSKWTLSAPIRFKLLLNSPGGFVNAYINEFSILKHKSGCELLLADFKLLFPEAADSLFIKWQSFVKRNIAIADKDVKDKKGREFLKKLATENLSPNTQTILLLALLPSIRQNIRVKIDDKQVKVSEAECRDSYLVHATNANNLTTAVRERREALSQGGNPGGQPLICAIGPSLTDIRSVHVNVANLDWVATSAVSAVDLCFKAFFALSIPYPKHSEHVWGTIQRAIYGIKTPSDSKVNFNYSWIKAVS